ncbi:MAG TPA: 16S rRNA (cytosine(967)-C(5))-methyltransferase RsmB [Steroidobacteraceae bacterium]|nr:16S rRNA (cytosine(967)-C(5))-methyltransferase RsmB [Steroidobacteraceae bacterium]
MNEIAAAVLAEAARALGKVAFAGRSADQALDSATRAPAAVRAITLGTLRWYWRLDAVATVLLGATRVTPPLRALLLVSLHQLEYSRNPPQATVSSAVDAVRMLGQPRAAGLANALLRRFLRERESLTSRALLDEAAASAHPRWLYDELRLRWPEHWRQIVEANNSHPPMTLRVNLSRESRDGYQARLKQLGMEARALGWSPTALILDEPVAVNALPGFGQGSVSVQDAGAQLAGALLGARPGERVLDACAAPGGKTGAILESVAGAVELTAIDVDATRVQHIAENLRRIGVRARVITADLIESATGWWDGEPFDRILLDAPCTATGVIRRHPDIKLLRRAQDVEAYAGIQQRMLIGCLSLLKPGGRLIYSTCSLMPMENASVVRHALAQVPRAQARPLPPAVALPPHSLSGATSVQLLPGNAALTDGFYYACLTVT